MELSLRKWRETFIKQHRDPRSKHKDEVIVTFECKEVRDAIKASVANLANYREEEAE